MKVVVAYSGPREEYTVTLALLDANLLDGLVTDVYWPHDRIWARAIEQVVGERARAALLFRNSIALPSKYVTSCPVTGLFALAMRKLSVPFSWTRAAMRWGDANIGRKAGRRAVRRRAAILSYSYYGYHAFSAASPATPKILFQIHPHPLSVRKILSEELALNPACASSLLKEWELALPKHDFDRLVEESRMADHWIVASSFSRHTLIEHGIPSDRIHVVTYGIDLERFAPPTREDAEVRGPLRMLFVGQINQRKGVGYLLSALDQLEAGSVELVICGRVVDDLSIFKRHKAHVEIRPSVGNRELVEAYRSADLFVLPSVVEGFGYVLLEAMASGLPILGTTRTAAPDLIESGVEGFVVEPGRSDLLAACIGWAVEHRRELAEMGRAARRKAETLTWDRYRRHIASIVRDIVEIPESETARQPFC
jgi:glycosyltransferase involved in cell wall biosynthesis